jgi:hypothetical protein
MPAIAFNSALISGRAEPRAVVSQQRLQTQHDGECDYRQADEIKGSELFNKYF